MYAARPVDLFFLGASALKSPSVSRNSRSLSSCQSCTSRPKVPRLVSLSDLRRKPRKLSDAA